MSVPRSVDLRALNSSTRRQWTDSVPSEDRTGEEDRARLKALFAIETMIWQWTWTNGMVYGGEPPMLVSIRGCFQQRGSFNHLIVFPVNSTEQIRKTTNDGVEVDIIDVDGFSNIKASVML